VHRTNHLAAIFAAARSVGRGRFAWTSIELLPLNCPFGQSSAADTGT
jgi:hypothetical protein